MFTEFITQIQNIEQSVGIKRLKNEKQIPYKVFDQVWIRADKPIMEIYSNCLKNSELLFYPHTNYKTWGVWFLKLLKLKKTNHSFKKLAGIGLRWPFLKKQFLPLNADVIYYRKHCPILIYSAESKVVIKTGITAWGKTLMSSEIRSQNLAYSIKSKDIFIPKILKEFQEDDIHFTVEEYFDGQRQSFKNKNLLESNYYKVFQFLLEFYLKNPIELRGLGESDFLNHEFVEEFIQKQEHGEEVVSFYRILYAKERKMIICRIHGDLNHNNILSNKKQVCIIDWGKSKQHYLARDLDNSSYNTEVVYEELVARANLEKKEIFSYQEQLFLGKFIEMNRLIHNGIKRKSIIDNLYVWTKKQNKELLEMGKRL